MQLGGGTAAEVARAAGVPRNKLYPAVQQLNRLGLAETRLGEAQVFRPLPLDRFLLERAAAMRARAEALDRERAELAGLFRPAPADETGPATFRVLHGRANLVEQGRAMLRAARTSLDLAPGRGGAARLIASGEAEVLRERLDEGLEVRLVLPPGAPAAAELAALLGGVVRAAPGWPPGTALLVADGRDLLLAQLQPDDGSPATGEDLALLAASPAMARVHAHGLGLAWAAAQAPREAVRPEAPSRRAA